MQAMFSDPQGPRWTHAVLQLPAAALAIVSLSTGDLLEFATWFLAAAAASSLVALLSLRQRRPVPATLTVGPGYVRVAATRARSATLRARDIVGASTARSGTGFVLSLARARRDTPTTLEVASEDDVEKLRRALGIGHGGLGILGWHTGPTHAQRNAFVGRLLAAATAAVLALAISADSTLAIALTALVWYLIPLGLALSALPLWSSSPPEIRMTAAGIELQTIRGPFRLPYADYRGFSRVGDVLVFPVPPPWHELRVRFRRPGRGAGLTDADLDVLRAQLDGAALRARGFGRTKEEVAGRVETLRRGHEPVRDWLARLDLAAQTLSAGTGYRGHALDAQDLWTVLEDPEADVELRTAAARVLRATPAPRVRIDTAIAAARDADTSARLRVAVEEELDEAAAHLENFDARRRLARLQHR